ncbi:hypothetical protein V8G54_035304 [Vigna mungo]|uniref:Transmembrane protein n=1 Tax=Vigna mungo TaxID=3915 RepID=A0AAQ3MEX3_VIGMU
MGTSINSLLIKPRTWVFLHSSSQNTMSEKSHQQLKNLRRPKPFPFTLRTPPKSPQSLALPKFQKFPFFSAQSPNLKVFSHVASIGSCFHSLVYIGLSVLSGLVVRVAGGVMVLGCALLAVRVGLVHCRGGGSWLYA